MATSTEIAENALTKSIERLKSSNDSIIPDEVMDSLEESLFTVRRQKLLEVGYTIRQLYTIFEQDFCQIPSHEKKHLEVHYRVHSRWHKTKPEFTSKCKECLKYRYSIGDYGNPQTWIQERIITEIETMYTKKDIQDTVQYIESIKSDNARCEQIQDHKLKVFFDKTHNCEACEDCILYNFLHPKYEMSEDVKNIIECWVQKQLNDTTTT